MKSHGAARHERYQRNRAKGEAAERKVLTALGRASVPWWVMSVRAAAPWEDHMGIDVVVETIDRGKLYLQVKSSAGNVNRFHREHRQDKRPIRAIMVRPDDDLNTVYGRALGALIVLRERSTLR